MSQAFGLGGGPEATWHLSSVDGKDAKLLWDNLDVRVQRKNCPGEANIGPFVMKIGNNLICQKHATLKFACWFRLNAKTGAFEPPFPC
jgi:hypothetical protein